MRITTTHILVILFFQATTLFAGPYRELGINGYIGPDRRHAPPGDSWAVVNPIFRGWAAGYRDYLPADDQWSGPWNDPNKALGPATGDKTDIVSLGDLSLPEILSGKPPGQITLLFDETIHNRQGYDFAVFENGFVSEDTWATGSISGQMFADLGFVEISTDGIHFARFPTVSLTPTPQNAYPYLTIEISDVYNLAGKHPNGYNYCTGTPFDLAELADDPLVVSGLVDLSQIHFIRIVDIPGSGHWRDQATECTDPCSWPDWQSYPSDHPLYDAWETWGSGGLDLEAIGILHEQEYPADINLDGQVDLDDFKLFSRAWLSRFGRPAWIGRCDLDEPKDLVIDLPDLIVFLEQWLQKEKWRRP